MRLIVSGVQRRGRQLRSERVDPRYEASHLFRRYLLHPLYSMFAGENISSQFVVPTVASCFDLVVHCGREPGGTRRVQEILAIGQRVENGVIETSPMFRRIGGMAAELVCTAAEVPSPLKFETRGIGTEGLLPTADLSEEAAR